MDTDPRAWSGAERAGAIVLMALALALGFIAADIMSGGRIFTRNCCPETEQVADES